jgi:hypothetical protein
MVDAPDSDEAQHRAWTRLGELGWAEAKINETLLLPKNPDLSRVNDTMRQTYLSAVEHGLSIVIAS